MRVARQVSGGSGHSELTVVVHHECPSCGATVGKDGGVAADRACRLAEGNEPGEQRKGRGAHTVESRCRQIIPLASPIDDCSAIIEPLGNWKAGSSQAKSKMERRQDRMGQAAGCACHFNHKEHVMM